MMVKVVGFERSDSSTILHLDKGDNDTHIHIIPDGIIEDRMEAHALGRVEALNLLLAEGHGDPDTPGAAARSQNANIEFDGVDPDEICRMSAVTDEVRAVISANVRREIAAIGQAESLARFGNTTAQLADGYQRLAQERLADDIIQANPKLKRHPRVHPDEPVGLAVKFV